MDEEELKNAVKDFTTTLLTSALEGKHKNVELLTNLSTLKIAGIYKSGLKKMYKELYKSANAYYNAYLKRIKCNIDDITLLLKHRTLLTCADYYKEEYKIADYEINEFHTYMLSAGNFIRTLLGYDRPVKEMYDHNKMLKFDFGEDDDDE